MATLFISELKIPIVIGIHPWERKVKQTLIFDFEFEVDIRKAVDQDDINYTVSYAKVCTIIQDFLQDKQYHLIETLADQVADMLLQKFSMISLRLVVRKPKVLSKVKEVGIIVKKIADVKLTPEEIES